MCGTWCVCVFPRVVCVACVTHSTCARLQVDRLSVILGNDAYAAIADQDSLSSVLDAARESVAASEAAESEGEGEGEGEEEAEA